MAETRQTLGFEASNAISTIARVANELAQYNSSIQAAAKATAAYNRGGAQFDKTVTSQARAIETFKKSVTGATTELNRLGSQQAQIQRRIEQIGKAAQQQANIFREQAKQAAFLKDEAVARRLNQQAIELENTALKKQQLLQQQLQRSRDRASQVRRDPQGLQAPSGQAGIEATVQRIKTSEQDAIARQQAVRASAKQTEVALRDAFRGVGDSAEAAGKRGAAAGETILLSWRSVLRIFSIQAIHQAIGLITTAFRQAITAAKDFEINLAEIQTISGDTFNNFEDLAANIRAVSEEFGQQSDIVAEGLYQTLSNQVVDAGESLDFLVTANRFATAAVTDTASAVNLLSSVINAFGARASDADDIAGKLFKTIELGRIRASEIANTFGRIAVLSNQLGVSLDETLASIATLTVQGLRYNEAFTLVQNTQLKLIRPTEALKTTFQELGVASAEAGIQAFGFQGFLAELQDTTGGTATEIGELFGRVRAIRGVLGLTSDAAERFSENLKAISEADAGTLDEAAAKVFATQAKQFQVEITKVQNAFLELGRDVIKVVNDISGVFGGFIPTAKVLFTAAIVGATTYGLVLKREVLTAQFALLRATVAQVAANFTLQGSFLAVGRAALAALATPLGAAIAATAVVVALAAAWRSVAQRAQEARDAQVDAAETARDIALDTEKVRRLATERAEDAILAKTQQVLFQRQRLFQQDAANARILQEAVFDGLGDQIADRLSVFEEFVGKLRDTAVDAKDKIKDLKNELADARFEAEQFQFDRALRGADDVTKAFKNIERSQDLLAKSQEAFAAGDRARAEELRKQAVSIAKAALSAADASKNTATQARAEEAVSNALETRVSFKEQELAAQRRFQTEAQKILPQEEARNTRLKIAIDRLKEFELISKDLVVDPSISPDEARKAARELAKFIQEEFENGAQNAKLLEKLDPELAALRKKLQASFVDPVSGQQIGKLEDLVDVSISNIVGLLSQQAKSLTPQQKIALKDLINIDFDDLGQAVQGFGPAQNQLAQLPRTQDAGERATEELTNAQAEFTTAVANTNKALSDVSSQITNVSRNGVQGTGKIASAWNAVNNVVFNVFDLVRKGDDAVGATVGQQIRTLASEVESIVAQDIISPEQTTAAQKRISAIQAAAIEFKDQGLVSVATSLNDLAKGLSSQLELKIRIPTIKEAAEPLGIIEQRVGALGDAFKNVNVESGQNFATAAATGAQQFDAASSTVQGNLDEEIRLLKERNALAAGGEGGAAARPRQFGGSVFRQFGGMLYRQAGGALARGTDNVLASLTRGESVNTVESTQDFFPQIQAMNAKVIPQFRQDGGTVTNVGDVNVTVNEAASPKETARQVMSDINRQIRRGTFNLRSSK